MALKCPFCSHEGVPLVSKQVAVVGWVLFAVLLLTCFPLCWIPFLVDGCKEEVKKCAGCGCKLG